MQQQYTVYHGTPNADIARRIEREGFKRFFREDYGTAVYVTPNKELAQQYANKNGVVFELSISGIEFNLSNRLDDFFKIKTPQKIDTELMKNGYDFLKHNEVIAVYRPKKISILSKYVFNY